VSLSGDAPAVFINSHRNTEAEQPSYICMVHLTTLSVAQYMAPVEPSRSKTGSYSDVLNDIYRCNDITQLQIDLGV
jgi:hypothetical protein